MPAWRDLVPFYAFGSFCFFTIGLLVFSNATQPFVLTEVYGSQRNGSASGVLALVDEVTSLVLAPFWGALSDKIGTRYVAVAGLWIMLGASCFYPRMHSFMPALSLVRGVFSLGASGAVAMIPANLAELTSLMKPLNLSQSESADSGSQTGLSRAGSPSSAEPYEQETSGDGLYHANTGEASHDGDETVPLFETPDVDNAEFNAIATSVRPNARLAGMAGFCSGLGAILAVASSPLVSKSDDESDMKSVFSRVSIAGFVVSLVSSAAMYQNPAHGSRSSFVGSENVSIFDEAALDAGGSMMSYLESSKHGFVSAQNDRRLVVAYLGSMVARSASVVIALFIPLWVNQWYYAAGRCHLRDPTDDRRNQGCHDAIVRAAISTGIANTMVVATAQLTGFAGDVLGAVRVLGLSAAVGIAATALLLVVRTPLGSSPVVAAVLIGVAQSGCMTISMAMSTDKRRIAPGSVAGVYSSAGSAGISLVTQSGGPSADSWAKSPFAIMGLMFAFLVVACHQSAKRTVLRSMRSFSQL